MTISHEELYRQRFADVSQQRRLALWEVLCRSVLERHIVPTDRVVDLGAGMCEFINTVRCREKIAIDANPTLRQRVAAGVEAIVGEIPAVLRQLRDASADVLFCSNFFEHLRNKDEVLTVLREVHRILVAGGRIIVIQPNIRYAYKEYWDFFDHHVALSHASFQEALQLTGFEIDVLRPRFLPYSTKTRLPQPVWLFRLFLALPLAQQLFGKQMLVVAHTRRPV
jgi:SAM-dependent methyltransferase